MRRPLHLSQGILPYDDSCSLSADGVAHSSDGCGDYIPQQSH